MCPELVHWEKYETTGSEYSPAQFFLYGHAHSMRGTLSQALSSGPSKRISGHNRMWNKPSLGLTMVLMRVQNVANRSLLVWGSKCGSYTNRILDVLDESWAMDTLSANMHKHTLSSPGFYGNEDELANSYSSLHNTVLRRCSAERMNL